MKVNRRALMQFGLGIAALPSGLSASSASDYPIRPVHLIVGFFAGSLSDIMARVMAQSLSEQLGQQFFVDNRPGAGANIATELVVRAAPDGYTLLLIPVGTAAVNAALYNNLTFDFIRDIAPVASIARTPGIVVVTPSLPVETIPELIAFAKTHPGKVNFPSGGIGSLPHVGGELFKIMAHVNLTHVAYRSNYFPDLLSGQTQVAFATLPSAVEFIKDGRLRPLAVMTEQRLDTWPQVPTVAEFVPGYEASAMNGLGAPRNTPSEVVNRLNSTINSALNDGAVRERFAAIGSVPLATKSSEFGQILISETEKWTKVIRIAGIKAE